MNLNLKRIFWPAVIGLAFAFTLWAQSPFYVGNFFDGVGVYIANGTNDASWMNVTNTLKVSGYLVDQGDLNVFGKESFDEGLISSDGLGHLTVVSITANSLTAPGGAVLPETNVVVYSGLSLGGSVGVGGGSIPVLSGSPLQFGLGTGLTYDANGIHAQYGINASNINAGTITNNVTAPNVTVTGNLIIPSGVKATNLSLYGTSTLQAGGLLQDSTDSSFLGLWSTAFQLSDAVGETIIATNVAGAGKITLQTGGYVAISNTASLYTTVGGTGVSNTGGAFYGSAAGLTSIPAGQLTGTVPTAQLGSGTANSTTYLRGDSTWQTGTSGITVQTNSVQLSTGITTVNIVGSSNALVTGSAAGGVATITVTANPYGTRYAASVQQSYSLNSTTYYEGIQGPIQTTQSNVMTYIPGQFFLTNIFGIDQTVLSNPGSNIVATLMTNGVGSSPASTGVVFTWTNGAASMQTSTAGIAGTNEYVGWKIVPALGGALNNNFTLGLTF